MKGGRFLREYRCNLESDMAIDRNTERKELTRDFDPLNELGTRS
jgi:hypothetical protein